MGAERADGGPPGAAEGARDVHGDARGVAEEPPGAHGDVRGAVEEAYAVFARCPLAARIEARPHRACEEDQRRLRSAPLRGLDADRLRVFTAGAVTTRAVTTWDDADDLRHFLPRVLGPGMSGDGDLDAVAGRPRLASSGDRDLAAVPLDAHARLEYL